MWRVSLIYLVMFLFGLTIIGKVFWLQALDRGNWEKQASSLKLFDIDPSRGNIYASDGRLLASSVPFFNIRMDFKSDAFTDEIFNDNVDSLSICLSKFFGGKSKEQYKKELIQARKQGKRGYLVKRNVTYAQIKEVKKFPLYRLGRYKSGVIYEQVNKRKQPHGELAKRTIGYTMNGDYGNVVGLEGAFDSELKGVKGKQLRRKVSGGTWIPVGEKNEIDPENGNDIVTTIDINIQDVANSALEKQLSIHEAHHGCAVLMEVGTGDVKAIVNLVRDKNGNYKEDYNYAIGESTEPGSTFKLPVIMAALEDGYIDIDDTIDTRDGWVRFYDKTIRDVKNGGYGKLTVQGVIEHSSNVGMSLIIDKYYKGKEEQFIDRLYSMRLNQKLDVGIKGEGTPEIKYPDDKYWSGISLPMISHGYEVRQTPLQILTFYNAIANGGKMMKPRFVKEIKYNDRVLKEFPTEVLYSSICSGSTIKKAKKMLEGVVEEGTATNLKSEHFKIAGKTGTAQIANDKYGYKVDSKVSHQASFVGYFPADNPKYSCIVVVNAPSSDVYYGNQVAGPVFQEIANKVYATDYTLHNTILAENVSPSDAPYSKHGYKKELDYVLNQIGCSTIENDIYSDWVTTKKENNSIRYKNEIVKDKLVPNVVEMGMKDAVFLLENAGLSVEVKGRGKVVKQSLDPGTSIGNNKTITLEMSYM